MHSLYRLDGRLISMVMIKSMFNVLQFTLIFSSKKKTCKEIQFRKGNANKSIDQTGHVA